MKAHPTAWSTTDPVAKSSLSSRKAPPDDPDYALLDHMRLAELHEAFLEGQINTHTRQTYANGIDAFFRFLAVSGLSDLLDVEPRHVASFVTEMDASGYETATVRLYLSALRMFLDACVVDGLLSVNPAKSVRAPRQSQLSGKTPVVMSKQVRQILDSIPDGYDSALPCTEADLRDRALIGLMTFSFFRVSAAIGLRLKDYVSRGDEMWLIAQEKGSKRHEMPVHPTLEVMLDDLIIRMGWDAERTPPDMPLFQSSTGRGGRLTGRPLDRTAAWRMVRKRARAAGLTQDVCNHTFRATGITAYLNAGGNLEDARIMANHSNATTTKLYDRTGDVAKAREIGRLRI